MKVLMFIDSLVMGGKERRLLELVKGFSKENDIECEIAIMNPDIYYKEIFDLNAPVHYLIRKINKDPFIFYKLFRLCYKIKPDIIHVWDSMTAIYAAPVAFVLRLKLINAMITDAPHQINLITLNRTKISALFSEIMLANSAAGLKAYKIPVGKGRYIHNGFSADRMKYIEDPHLIRQKFDIVEQNIVGIVGALEVRKDFGIFIEAAKLILQEKLNVCFLIIGDGHLRQSLENSIPAEYKLKIRFLGQQTNVESIVNIFNIGVLTSNQAIHGEGISNAILEYMEFGKPVVATNDGGTPEIVDDGVTGFLVKESSAEDLKEKISILLDNENLANSMGEAGRKKVLSEFSIESMVNQTLDLYKEVLN